MQNKALTSFRAAWKAGVPLITIDSADPAQTIRNCIFSLNGKSDKIPLIEWDCVAGARGTQIPGQPADLGQNAAMAIAEGTPGPEMLTNPVEFLSCVARKAPEETIVFCHGMHRMIGEGAIAQALWNCRDTGKPKHVTVVCLGPSVKPPAELSQDVMALSEDLPGADELSAIINSTLKDAELKPEILNQEQHTRAVDILRGLSAFAAEQVFATSLTKQGVDFEALWARKVRMIEQTPGLSVWQGGGSFDDLGGLNNLKDYLTLLLGYAAGTPDAIRAIGFIDEIEKGLAGAGGDTSGTSQDQLQVFLKLMQDLNIPGIILVGHAGTGKSAIAKAAGGIGKCPVISIDTGAMKGSLVGESESRIRAAMDVFKAVSVGKGFFIATCNKIDSLPPELRRRFSLGTFFVDLPTATEQKTIWDIWIKRYKLPEQATPKCTDWTGAEIRACCDVASRTGMSLDKASKFVVPVIKSAPESVSKLRQLAHNRFISASYSGEYQYKGEQQSAPATTG